MHTYLQTFDRAVAVQVAKLPGWLLPLMTIVSFLGLPAVIVSASLLIMAVSYRQEYKNVSAAFGLAIVALGGNGVLKMLFRRVRPETMYVESMAIKSYSFPSGH